MDSMDRACLRFIESHRVSGDTKDALGRLGATRQTQGFGYWSVVEAVTKQVIIMILPTLSDARSAIHCVSQDTRDKQSHSPTRKFPPGFKSWIRIAME